MNIVRRIGLKFVAINKPGHLVGCFLNGEHMEVVADRFRKRNRASEDAFVIPEITIVNVPLLLQ